MRVAVLSDIHGFSLALDTVLADLDATGPYDTVVIAGDLCELGPAPRAVLERLWQRGYPAVYGNTDRYLVDGAAAGTDDPELHYAIDRIGPDGLAYLASLPFSHRVTPPDGNAPEDDLLVVHANPRNVEDALDPALSDNGLRAIIGSPQASALAFGHIHICYTRQLDDLLLVDVSAVGNPKDGDLRCKYGVLTWDAAARRWTAELRRLPYPLPETEEQIRASDLPKAEKVIKKLRRATYKDRE